MDVTLYKEALEQAKKDLARATHELGVAQENAILAEGEIVELRQTIAALAKLCGESEFVEEDALGLTDAIRQVFKAHMSANRSGGNGLDAHEVRETMELMGYAGRWGNLLASIHTVLKRLHEKGEIEAAGNINGRETYRWKESRARIPADHPVNKLRWNPRKTFGQRIAEVTEAPEEKIGTPPSIENAAERSYRGGKLGHHKLSEQIRDGKK